MLYDVEYVANQFGVSKQAIYNKLKLKELKPYIVKKQGKSMVDDEGLNWIKDNLKSSKNLNNDDNSDLNEDIQEEEKLENTIFDDDLINLNKDLINALIQQLHEKDKQIEELNSRLAKEQELHQNTQILLKQEQSNPKDMLLLEEHFKEIDDKLIELQNAAVQLDHDDDSVKKVNLWSRIFKG